eukprot:gene23025-biopygen4282
MKRPQPHGITPRILPRKGSPTAPPPLPKQESNDAPVAHGTHLQQVAVGVACGADRVFSVQRRSLRYQQKGWSLECTLQRCYKGGVRSWIRWMAKIVLKAGKALRYKRPHCWRAHGHFVVFGMFRAVHSVFTSELHHAPGWACRTNCLWAAPPQRGAVALACTQNI